MSEFVKIKNNLIEDERQNQKETNWLLSIMASLLFVASIVLFLNTFVFINISVVGESMLNTLQSGDVVIANRLKEAEHGDIIVLDGVKQNGWIIKRVIGLEGDTVMIKDGKVFLNGEALDEPYAKGITYAYGVISEGVPVTLEEGQIFYLGDNRTNSSDTRMYGLCTTENVVCVVEDWSLNLRHITAKLVGFFSTSNGH